MSDIKREWTASEIQARSWNEEVGHYAVSVDEAEFLAKCTRLWASWDTLFAAIEHGEPDHRGWLKEKLETWYRAAMRKPEKK